MLDERLNDFRHPGMFGCTLRQSRDSCESKPDTLENPIRSSANSPKFSAANTSLPTHTYRNQIEVRFVANSNHVKRKLNISEHTYHNKRNCVSNISSNLKLNYKPSADFKSCHTKTSFPVLPCISDTDSEVGGQYCTQDLQQDFLSL